MHAAFETTRSVPIVALDLETDPVKAGMVGSLNRPGGNVTGVFFDAPQIAGKWLQLLRDVLPSINLVGLLYDEHTDRAQMIAAEDAAPTLGIRTVRLPVNAPDDIPRVIGRAAESTVGALLNSLLSDLRGSGEGDLDGSFEAAVAVNRAVSHQRSNRSLARLRTR